MNWNTLWPLIEQAAIDAAKTAAQQFAAQAATDAKAFLKTAAASLLKYTTQLKANDITQDEFADLVNGLKDLATMNALTEAGLAEVALEAVRNAVTDAVIQVVLDAVKV